MPQEERLKKAVKWLSEIQLANPTKDRLSVIREAGIRFDLTPKESEFLEKKFKE